MMEIGMGEDAIDTAAHRAQFPNRGFFDWNSVESNRD